MAKMFPQKLSRKNRSPKTVREELLDWLDKGEALARKSLKGQPEALREILGTMGRVRKVVDRLLANPRTLGRLTCEITSRVGHYSQESRSNPAAEPRSRALLLEIAQDVRSEVEGIEADRGLHFD